jgi:hypothetical protein
MIVITAQCPATLGSISCVGGLNASFSRHACTHRMPRHDKNGNGAAERRAAGALGLNPPAPHVCSQPIPARQSNSSTPNRVKLALDPLLPHPLLFGPPRAHPPPPPSVDPPPSSPSPSQGIAVLLQHPTWAFPIFSPARYSRSMRRTKVELSNRQSGVAGKAAAAHTCMSSTQQEPAFLSKVAASAGNTNVLNYIALGAPYCEIITSRSCRTAASPRSAAALSPEMRSRAALIWRAREARAGGVGHAVRICEAGFHGLLRILCQRAAVHRSRPCRDTHL